MYQFKLIARKMEQSKDHEKRVNQRKNTKGERIIIMSWFFRAGGSGDGDDVAQLFL